MEIIAIQVSSEHSSLKKVELLSKDRNIYVARARSYHPESSKDFIELDQVVGLLLLYCPRIIFL